jgi:hypothetical protein
MGLKMEWEYKLMSKEIGMKAHSLMGLDKGLEFKN